MSEAADTGGGPRAPARFGAFDCVVLAGAVMNLLVVAVLVGYWLLAG